MFQTQDAHTRVLGSARRWRALFDGSSNGSSAARNESAWVADRIRSMRDLQVFGGPPKTARQRRALPR
jgi:hypothetical protein